MSNALQTLQDRIVSYPNDPSSIQRDALALLREASNGTLDIVDPSNPFVFLMEMGATLTSAAITANKAQTRRVYPFSAQTLEELYPHMSDKDFVDRFAIPATAKILLLMSKEEVLQNLVTDPNNNGIKKMVIPRNTYFEVGGMRFSMQYPIEIRQMAHEGLSIVYDAEVVSPLLTLQTNEIQWSIITSDIKEEFIAFEIDVTQFFIDSRTLSVTLSKELNVTIPLTDQYYYCRVYKINENGSFTELATTHTSDTYNINNVTAVLRVLEGQLQVRIPQIYTNTGQINSKIRVDVYQTRGPLNVTLSRYLPSEFKANFISLDPAEMNEFVAPWKAFRSYMMQSRSVVNGGKNAMTFAELQERVNKNAVGSPDLPVTNTQIEASLDRAGYTLVRNIDNITNRVYQAVSPMPVPSADSQLITAAAGGMATVATSIANAVSLGTVVDNGDLITIKPDTLYRINNGIVEFVPTAEVDALKALEPDQRAVAVTNGNYLYAPFHYVMDIADNEFSVRPYYLDSPIVLNKSFVGENDTTLLQVTTSSYVIQRTANGYTITISTSSSDAWKDLDDDEVFVQLAFVPIGEADRAYVQGQLLGKTDDGERMYQFDLSTNLRLTKQHGLGMLAFQMYNETPRVTDMPLETTFDIFYSTNTAKGPQWKMSTFDTSLGHFQLPPDAYAVTYEKLAIRFGNYLEHLWARSRSVVGDAQYAKWETDVPAVYLQDVLKQDPVTGAAFDIIDGELVYTVLHKQGDPILDVNGEPTMRFHKGDIKLDEYGNPTVVQGRQIVRQMDFLLVEGSYYFATDEVSAAYTKSLVETIVDRLVNEMPGLGDNLLEQTSLLYFPTSTIGPVDVYFSNDLTTTINAAQNFRLTLSVSGKVYESQELRNALTRKTIATIGAELSKRVVAHSNIVDQLKATYGGDVIAIDLSKLGGSAALGLVTMKDDSRRLSIRKRLVANSDGNLRLEEDVTVEWSRADKAS